MQQLLLGGFIALLTAQTCRAVRAWLMGPQNQTANSDRSPEAKRLGLPRYYCLGEKYCISAAAARCRNFSSAQSSTPNPRHISGLHCIDKTLD
jgi:hypothetical protein